MSSRERIGRARRLSLKAIEAAFVSGDRAEQNPQGPGLGPVS